MWDGGMSIFSEQPIKLPSFMEEEIKSLGTRSMRNAG